MLETAILCLSLNIYHEARNQPVIGQKAVAQVTMNLAQHKPNKVCEVVFDSGKFSWTRGLTRREGKARARYASQLIPKETRAWETAKQIARKAVRGQLRNVVGKATHYYNPSLANPKWAATFTKVAHIGSHIFMVN